jgi:hypothetical protein
VENGQSLFVGILESFERERGLAIEVGLKEKAKLEQ